jgi:hypothetical protein
VERQKEQFRRGSQGFDVGPTMQIRQQEAKNAAFTNI